MANSAMASSADHISKVGSDKAPSFPLVPFLIATVLSVLLAVGATAGVLLWFIHSGRMSKLPITTVVLAPQPANAGSKSHAIAMEPLLVNLADTGGQSYLRVGIVLRIEDPSPAKEPKKDDHPVEKGSKPVNESEAALRDVALNVISRQTTEELLSPDGKDALKLRLKGAMVNNVPELKVTEVFFTEFLVQR